jgi:hypothetical protein
VLVCSLPGLHDMKGRAQLLCFPQQACTLVGKQWRLQLTLLVLFLQAYLWDLHSMFFFRLVMVSRNTHHLSCAVCSRQLCPSGAAP